MKELENIINSSPEKAMLPDISRKRSTDALQV
jgi:hypothetical protein